MDFLSTVSRVFLRGLSVQGMTLGMEHQVGKVVSLSGYCILFLETRSIEKTLFTMTSEYDKTRGHCIFRSSIIFQSSHFSSLVRIQGLQREKSCNKDPKVELCLDVDALVLKQVFFCFNHNELPQELGRLFMQCVQKRKRCSIQQEGHKVYKT